MTGDNSRAILVTGATGLQGGAVARRLLANGWHVRALTRHATGEKAKALTDLGAQVIQGDMADMDSLAPAMAGTHAVFSVQNPMISGIAGEIAQGKNVALAAQQAGVQHLVYASAGTGAQGTGVPSWESKLVVEEYMRSLALPLTILRPTAFMELMTDKKFYPAMSTWYLMPKLMGSTTRLPWLCSHDLAFIVAKAFADPAQFIGKDLQLASDVQSIDECRTLYRAILGRNPPRFPLPVWLFTRFGFVGQDLTTMWRWLHTAQLNVNTGPTLALHPDALTVRTWLEQQQSTARS
jgi:uncharacterized protein YbjT (DUF2867 family)